MEKSSTNRRRPPFAVIWTAVLTIISILYIISLIVDGKRASDVLKLRTWYTQGVSLTLCVIWQLTIIVITIEYVDYGIKNKRFPVLRVIGRLLLSFFIFAVFTLVSGCYLIALGSESEIRNENGTITVCREEPYGDDRYRLYEKENIFYLRYLRPMRDADDTDASLTLEQYNEIMRQEELERRARDEQIRKEQEEAERQERAMWEKHWEEQRREEEERIEQLYLEMETLDTYIKTEGDLAGIESSDSIHLEAEREMNARAQPYLVVYLEYVPEDIAEDNRTIIIERTLQYNRTTEQGDQFVYKERWHDSENRSLKDAELLNFFVVNPDTMEIMDEDSSEWH